MKRLVSMKNILIAIAFTVFLLLIKDNMDIVFDILKTIISILNPFFVGFLIAYILNFPFKFFHNKVFSAMGKKRKFFVKLKIPLSILCTYASAAAVLVVLLIIVVPQISNNIANLIDNLPAYSKVAMYYLNEILNWINSTFGLELDLDKAFQEAFNSLTSFLTNVPDTGNSIAVSKSILSTLSDVVANTAAGLYNLSMGVIISIYFLSAKEQLCRQVKKLAVAFIPIKYLPKIYEIVDITDTKCGRFLVGDILDAALVGTLLFVVMSIFNLPYAALIAVLVGVTNIIPFFGPIIGGVPSALILFLIDPMEMIIFLVILVVIQQLDGNLFKPTIIGNQLGISSFWVLFSVIVGGALFGIIGFVLGTPIYAVIYSLVGKRVRNNISEKGKIAQEALDFEVLNYAKIAEEQKRIREQKEKLQKEKLKKLIRLNKHNDDDDNYDDDSENDIDDESGFKNKI